MTDSPTVIHLRQQLDIAVAALLEIRQGGNSRPGHYIELARRAVEALLANPEPGAPNA